MTIEAARFVVRDKDYPQESEYPTRCAEITNQLLTRVPPVNDINDLLQSTVEAFSANRPYKDIASGAYGEIRNILPGSRPGSSAQLISHPIEGSKYRRAVEERARSKGVENGNFVEKISYQHRWKQDADKAEERNATDLPMTAISMSYDIPENAFFNMIEHPKIYASQHNDQNVIYNEEHRWSAAAQSFRTALESTGKKSKDAAVECYWLLSHDCPLTRGSATFARIALEFMAERAGFEVPLVKENIDLNMQALTHTLEEFKQKWEEGAFFDIKTTSKEVLDWHAKESAIQRKRNQSLGDIASGWSI